MLPLLGRLRKSAQRAGQLASIAATSSGLTSDYANAGPLYAQVSVSDPCDHRCVMCCYHPPSETSPALEQFGGDRPGIMKLDTFESLGRDLHRAGTRQIDLVGRGEPLLNPHVVEMIAVAKRMGMTVTMISNGSRLGMHSSALIAAGLDRFRLSLDAGSAETYPKIHVSETPESFAKVTADLAQFVRQRGDRTSPHISVSFTIGALNFREIVAMVDVVDRAGADAAHFQHVLPVTSEARATSLTDDAFRELTETLISAAANRANEVGVHTNLKAFAASVPADREGDHSAAVPCYIGSYFTVVLGNGNVLPCCQTERPVGSLSEGFTKVWNGERYRAFRYAARHLPERNQALDTCDCDHCYFRPHNISVHKVLHPFANVSERGRALISIDHLLRMSRLDPP